jgi:hypothetical protein
MTVSCRNELCDCLLAKDISITANDGQLQMSCTLAYRLGILA